MPPQLLMINQELISFGNYILSPERWEALSQGITDEDDLTERALVVTQQDINNWEKTKKINF